MAEKANLFEYNDDSVKTLDWREHIRLRPGMYIGKLGDGSSPDDGIYVMLKEVIDNCIDEYTMGYGKQVEISIEQKTVTVRDFGRGIPLGATTTNRVALSGWSSMRSASTSRP